MGPHTVLPLFGASCLNLIGNLVALAIQKLVSSTRASGSATITYSNSDIRRVPHWRSDNALPTCLPVKLKGVLYHGAWQDSSLGHADVRTCKLSQSCV
jgi:hypothetical protein